MNSEMLLAAVDDEVRIVDGRLVIPEATRSLLGTVLAPTDNPRAQLRHLLDWLVDWQALELQECRSIDRLTMTATVQLMEAIQVQLSYAAFLRSAGTGARRPGVHTSIR